MAINLITKYRPQSFGEVIGHDAVVRSLQSVCKRKDAQIFLFVGPAGTGKTTLARLVVHAYGVEDQSILEIDAASKTGIDDMRQLQEMIQYRPFGNSGQRAIIIDECFAPGTLVNTPYGEIPIEKLNVKDFIVGAKGVAQISKVMKRKVNKAHIIALRLLGGLSIIISKDHPFLTTQGWVAAEHLDGKQIYTIQETKIPHCLQEMWDGIYESQSWVNANPKIGCVESAKTCQVRVDNLSDEEWAYLRKSASNGTDSEDSFEFYDLEIDKHPSFGVHGLIAHNCHGLSKNAWDSLLKVTEEPPQHVVWCFCTTNPAKLPKTFQTRSARFELKPVSDRDLGELYDFVCDQERINLAGDVGDLLIREAKGSPRQLLSNIVVARTARNKKEAAELLRTAIESEPILELCRFVADGGGSWAKAMGIMKKLEEENPESVRIQIANYLAACLKGAKTDQSAAHFMAKLDHFLYPYDGLTGSAPLLLSLGRCLFSE